MQTFMQQQSYKLVAQELDDKRLGKQRVEAYQISKALKGDYATSGAWENHPATLMWRGYEHQLGWYGFYICQSLASKTYCACHIYYYAFKGARKFIVRSQ